MPDATGKLTQEDKEKIKAWLGKFSPGIDSVCPVCKSTTWYICEHIVQPITLNGAQGLQLGGLSYPQVMLNSIPCGYTLFLNAVIMGLAPAAPPGPPPPPSTPAAPQKS